MSTALNTTFETLAKSRNEATNALLLTALESSDQAVFEGAIKTIIARRSKTGHLAVLKRWHTLSAEQQQFLEAGRGRMSSALRDAILDEDDQLFVNACVLVEHFQEFDMIATLVNLAENQTNPHAEVATQLVWRLVQKLSEELFDKQDKQKRRDPQAFRRNAVESLERSVQRYRTHKRNELIDAYVVLCGPTSSVLRKILDDPHHACYLTVINTLTHSDNVGVMQMLIDALSSDLCSPNILTVISKRTDPEFVNRLLPIADAPFSPATTKNLKRIRMFAWLQHGAQGYDGFTEQDHIRCIKLASASGISTDALLDVLESVLKFGEAAARWEACEALAAIPGDRGNHLVLEAIADKEPQVKASATRQLRDRHIPGAMSILLKQLDSPHDEVREATCEALSEFSLANFLVGYEGLSEEARRSTASLVKKVDPAVAHGILEEMGAGSRKRRLRAIEVAELMDLLPKVTEGLIELIDDEDHLVRAAAAEALQFCHSVAAEEALRYALSDKSEIVKQAAKSSLEVLDGGSFSDSVTADFQEGEQ